MLWMHLLLTVGMHGKLILEFGFYLDPGLANRLTMISYVICSISFEWPIRCFHVVCSCNDFVWLLIVTEMSEIKVVSWICLELKVCEYIPQPLSYWIWQVNDVMTFVSCLFSSFISWTEKSLLLYWICLIIALFF